MTNIYKNLSHISPKPRKNSVSIIIPVFNLIQYTRQVVNSIYENTSSQIDWEILIIDNGSTDATSVEMPYDWRTRILRNDKNLGFAKACNQGARISQKKYLVFLNNDMKVFSGWIEALLDELDKHPDTGIVGGRLIYPDGTIQHAGVAIDKRPLPFHIFSKICNAIDPYVMQRRTFPCVTGACMAVRRQQFLAIGLFDENFINSNEDVDLCFRYGQVGLKCVYRPDCLGIHYESKTPGRSANISSSKKLMIDKWHDRLIQDDFSYRYMEVLSCAKPRRFTIKIGTPNSSQIQWGDIYYAESFAAELYHAGHKCRIDYRQDWNRDDENTDVVIHLAGLGVYSPKPYNINIIWLISHPEAISFHMLEQYDAVCVASRPHARYLKNILNTPVFELLQATDPAIHFPVLATKKYDVVFVGSNIGEGRAPLRKIIDYILPEDRMQRCTLKLGIWGPGWRGKIPASYIVDEYLPHHEQNLVYSQAKIVLNDHHTGMASFGFINDRTFTAIACGSFVISDRVVGMEELLDIPQVESREEMQEIVKYVLSNPDYAENVIKKNRKIVLEQFTFRNRVQELENILTEIEKESNY